MVRLNLRDKIGRQPIPREEEEMRQTLLLMLFLAATLIALGVLT
jgi:hypothetical protein